MATVNFRAVPSWGNNMTDWLCRSLLVACASAAPYAHAAQVLEVDLPANALAYSAQTHLLYATIPSRAGAPFGNELVSIDPADAAIVGSVFVGSEPGPVATSPDEPKAYVGLNGAAAVRPVALDTMTAGTQFILGTSDIFGPLYAADLAVMPGAPDTVAVSRRDEGFSPSYQGVAIFDNGVMRPQYDTNFTGGNSIAFDDDPSVLYGYDNEVSDFNLCRYSIDASGISGQSCVSYVFSGFFVTIVYDSGTIFASSGSAVDSSTFTLLGTYDAYGPVVVDGNNVVFVEDDVVTVFDRETYVPTQSFTVPSNGGLAIDVSNCGSGCVAIAYDSGRILIVTNYFDAIFANGFE